MRFRHKIMQQISVAGDLEPYRFLVTLAQCIVRDKEKTLGKRTVALKNHSTVDTLIQVVLAYSETTAVIVKLTVEA